MNNKDFQNGFALGYTSGGVVEVVDTTEIDNLEDLIDNSGVLEDTEGSVSEKVEELIDRVYVEYPLPQDDYVYYRYPPCNEDRYIGINTSSVEYGTLNADGYTKVGEMNGVYIDNCYKYKFIIPAHKQDFIIKLSAMPLYCKSSADCTEVYCGSSNNTIWNRFTPYEFTHITINGIKKITINKPLNQQQHASLFQGLPFQTINLQTVNISNNSFKMFLDCIFLKHLQFEKMTLKSPYELFKNCCSLEEVDCSKIVPTGDINNMFNGCTCLKTLDLSTWASQSSTFTNVNGLIRYCKNLKTLNLSGWNLSHITTLYDWFWDNTLLENFILDNAILFAASFSIAKCTKLTQESINAIINALPTITTAKTITIYKDVVLTDEQKATINAKGWTLAQ